MPQVPVVTGPELVHVPVEDIKFAASTAHGADPAFQFATCVMSAGNTVFGGGFFRFEGDAEQANWTLPYDEIILVLEGELTVVTHKETVIVKAGGTVCLRHGTWTTIRGKRGTRAFYTTFPRDWPNNRFVD